MARVLVGVTGGIAAYKACELVRLLVKAGHDVVPLVTPGAERFVRAETFAALARRRSTDDLYPHLARADLLVVAPCTANTLAKLAHGLADTVLTEAALAHRGPLLVAPAMNPRMWSNPATQANVELLRARGVELLGPAEGDTAEGESGVGRMVEPAEIFSRVQQLVRQTNHSEGPEPARPEEPRGDLTGKRVLVTAGGTREPIDVVRFVGNRSSGHMGVALAEEARRRGAEVTLLAANLAVPAPAGVEVVQTPTAAEMAREALARADEADLVVMAAAVADYRPAEPRADKRAKDTSNWTVELEPTTDILAELGGHPRDGRVLVGFAADTGEGGLARARAKLQGKGTNLFVYNDVSRADIGFESPDNEVVLLTAHEERPIGKAPKEAIAAAVLDEAVRLLEQEARMTHDRQVEREGTAMAATPGTRDA